MNDDTDAKTNPDPTGHYGPGYGDPTKNPQTDPADPALTSPDIAPTATDEGAPGSGISSDDVGLRPPDHVPADQAAPGENPGLIFERS